MSSCRTIFCLLAFLAAAASVAATSCQVATQRVQCGSLTCNASSLICQSCTESPQCFNTGMQCVGGECMITPVADAVWWGSTLSVLTVIVVCSVAAVAGVGGGAILVAVFYACLGVPVANSVAFSQAAISGQALLNVIVQLSRHHPEYQAPKPTRPLINYQILVMWLPISLVGTLFGNLAGKVVPDWFRMALLVLLLSYVLYRVVVKVISQRQADSQKLLDKSGQPADVKPASPVNVQSADGATDFEPEEAAPQYPKLPILLIFLAFVPLAVINYIRNPKADLMSCGSLGFWACIIGISVYEVALTVFYRNYLKGRRQQVLDGTLSDEEIPFKWNHLTTVVFPILSSTAGGAASLLGIGGGLILNFLLLEAQLAPEEASATSAMFTFLVATESALQYVIQGAIRYDWGLLMLGAGLVSTLLGQFVFVKTIKAKGWRFLIIGALAAIMAGSMIATVAVGIYNTVETVHNHGSLGFGELCKK